MARAALAAGGDPDVSLFFNAMGADEPMAQAALREIAKAWRPSFTIMFVEMLRLRSESVRQRLLRFLVEQTKQDFEADPAKWSKWVWSLPYRPHAQYAKFKGILYSLIDPRMGIFFPPHVAARIRLDQVE
jgi:hypothetical protein